MTCAGGSRGCYPPPAARGSAIDVAPRVCPFQAASDVPRGPMLEQPLKFFVVFFVVVEPISLIPLFSGLTRGATREYQRRMAVKAVWGAALIRVLFALGGGPFRAVMGISLGAFLVFGGALRFLLAVEMVRAGIGQPHLERRAGGEPATRGHLRVSRRVSLHCRTGRARHRAPLVRPGAHRARARAVPRPAGGRRRGARHHAGHDAARRAADAAHGGDGRERHGAAPRGDPRGAGGAVRDRRTAHGVFPEARLSGGPAGQPSWNSRSQTWCPRRSPRRSNRVGDRSAGRGTKPLSAATLRSRGSAESVASICTA